MWIQSLNYIFNVDREKQEKSPEKSQKKRQNDPEFDFRKSLDTPYLVYM